MSKNYRLEGLRREANDVANYLIREVGLMGCDLEIIGALLFIKYKGEDKRISEMLDNASKLLKEADKFLNDLKNKKNE